MFSSSGWLVTMNKQAVDLNELAELLTATGQNCLQFPLVSNGSVSRVENAKLHKAIQFSDIVVAVFVKATSLPGGDYMQQRVGEGNKHRHAKRLVGFGRAVSDQTFAASIHDLAVAPSLQRQGIGRLILQRITRYLYYQRGIADISALTPSETLPFFTRCGFKPDSSGSTTMLYTKAAVGPEDDAIVVGRLPLLVPSLSMKTRFTAL